MAENNETRNHRSYNLHYRSMFWMATALVCILAMRILPTSCWEVVYYQRLFPVIRQAYDFTFGWIPFPVVYLVLAILIFRTATWFRQMSRGWVSQASRALGGLAAMISLFYLLWGFNYRQIPLTERLGMSLGTVSEADISEEYLRASEYLIKAANQLPGSLLTDETISDHPIRDSDLRELVENALRTLGLPAKGRVRVRQLWPPGTLLRWSTAGIYIPQSLEGHIDKGLLAVQKPFTLAHEMAHGYGVTDEGACNFIAWLACSHSNDPWIQFSSALSYWRYAAAEMPRDSISNTLQEMPDIVRRSLAQIRENDRRYPDLMPRIRDKIYASYLRQHGIREGLRSYNEVVSMVALWTQKDKPGN